jgi:hypothetical protein
LRSGRTRRFQLLHITLSRGHGFLVQWRASCFQYRQFAVACELLIIETAGAYELLRGAL